MAALGFAVFARGTAVAVCARAGELGGGGRDESENCDEDAAHVD